MESVKRISRDSGHMEVYSRQDFVRLIIESYQEALKLGGFGGIKILGSSVKISGGSGKENYSFEANFLEKVRGKVYTTKWSFGYSRDIDDTDNLQDDVAHQMSELNENLHEKGLSAVLSPDKQSITLT